MRGRKVIYLQPEMVRNCKTAREAGNILREVNVLLIMNDRLLSPLLSLRLHGGDKLFFSSGTKMSILCI